MITKIILFFSLISFQGMGYSIGIFTQDENSIRIKFAEREIHSLKLTIKKNNITGNDLQSPLFLPDELSGMSLFNPQLNSIDSVSIHNIQNYNYIPSWHSMFTNLPGDMVRFYHQEFTIERIPIYLSIAALTSILIATDEHTYRQSDQIYHSSTFIRNTSDVFVAIGDGRSQFGLAAIFAGYGFIANDNRALRTASQVVEAVLASGAVVQVLKHITGRESPISETTPGGRWRFFPNQIKYHKHVSAYDAFPSGHLTTSLAAFVVIAENYPEQKWIYPVSYAVCAMVGIGMVNRGIHWYSDYPLAVAIGYGFGKLIAHPIISGDETTDNRNIDVSVMPYIDFYSKGLRFSINF